MRNIGYYADFKTGYLQKALPLHQATVAGGIDVSAYDADVTGYAVRRLVKVTASADGTYTLVAPTTGVGSITATDLTGAVATKVAAGLGDATHIIAQSDNSTRSVPEDYIPTEKYTTLYDGIVKNSDTDKLVAVYKIVNGDDIKLISIDTITRADA
jgi:hypothetical protein